MPCDFVVGKAIILMYHAAEVANIINADATATHMTGMLFASKRRATHAA